MHFEKARNFEKHAYREENRRTVAVDLAGAEGRERGADGLLSYPGPGHACGVPVADYARVRVRLQRLLRQRSCTLNEENLDQGDFAL